MNRPQTASTVGPLEHRLAGAVVVLVLATIAGVGVAMRPTEAVAFALGCAGILVLSEVRARWCLVAAIVVLLVVPAQSLPVPGIVARAPLAAIPFAVWVLRGPRASAVNLPLLASSLAFLAWILLSLAFSPDRSGLSFYWVIGVGLTLCLPWIRQADLRADIPLLTGLLIGGTAVVAVYAVVESVVFQSNPVYGWLYSRGPWPISQHWSEYRVTSSLGHPLVNGSIFASVAVLALGRLVDRPTLLHLLSVAALAAGVAVTLSRSAAISFVAGAIVLLLFTRGRQRLGRKLVVAIAIIVVGAAFSGALLSRAGTDEARASVEVRSSLVSQTMAVVDHTGPFGAGPGQTDGLRQRAGLPGAPLPLESAYAQAAGDLGLIGLGLFAILLIGAVICGLRFPEGVPAGAALVSLLVSVAGYRAWASALGLFTLAGLYMCCIVAAAQRREDPLGTP